MEKNEIKQSYSLTNKLRWGYIDDTCKIGHLTQVKKVLVLQQMWQGEKGHQKWEEVPTEH